VPLMFWTENAKGGKYHCTIDLLFDWFGISCMTTDNFCFYLQNRLIQTSQTGGQQYTDISPFSIPCFGQRRIDRLHNGTSCPPAWFRLGSYVASYYLAVAPQSHQKDIFCSTVM
jgi:hypothetical protein